MRQLMIVGLFLAAGFAACNSSDPSTEKKSSHKQKRHNFPKHESLINPFYLPYFIENVGIEYYPLLFNRKLNTGLYKANFYVKNGRLPNNISEKFTYLFNTENQLEKLSHFSQTTYNQPYSDFIFNYNEEKNIEKMDIIKYMSILNQPPFYYNVDSLYSTIVIPKDEIHLDSIYFFPSFEQPELVYLRSNNKTIEIRIFLPIGATKEDIKAEIDTYKDRLQVDEFTSILLTYTDNGLPIETYELSSNLESSFKIRAWNYNQKWLPVKYVEYLHGSMIKDMAIEYNELDLPNFIRMNKKEFNAYYEFQHVD
ncbi:MAG: hypothetical protein J0G96_07895 [Flavobacteriia bacterium]|nr:hypothetical protein [Flavobacteriia bacterium]